MRSLSEQLRSSGEAKRKAGGRLLPGAWAGNRREWFRAALRYGLLALLAAVTALAARSRGAAGQNCVRRGLCGGCGEFAACELPAALSAKSARLRVKNDRS